MINDKYLHSDVTDIVIKCYFLVYNKLSYGFLEKVYENALLIELEQHGLSVESQKKIDVYYYNHRVGEYYADLVINDKVIVELKANEALREDHVFQLLNYLKATQLEVGLLLNFGKKPEFTRRTFINEIKS